MKGRKKQIDKKSILIVTVFQVLLWAAFTLGDSLEEMSGSGSSVSAEFFFSFVLLILPLAVGILYLVFQRKLCRYNDILLCQGPLFFFTIWLAEMIGFSVLILNMGGFSLFFLPMLLPMLFYLLTSVFSIRLNKQIDILKVKTFAFLSAVWGIETFLFGGIILSLIDKNRWIVYQNPGQMLNGLEYFMFFWFCAVLPITVIMVGKIFVFVILSLANGKEESE